MAIRKKRNDGYSVKRLREILGVKQDALVVGLKMDQSQISRLENREIIDDDILAQIADILKIPVDAIKNFSEEQAVKVITGNAIQYNMPGAIQNCGVLRCSFNPLEKIVELYERLLAAERKANQILADSKKTPTD